MNETTFKARSGFAREEESIPSRDDVDDFYLLHFAVLKPSKYALFAPSGTMNYKIKLEFVLLHSHNQIHNCSIALRPNIVQ